MTGENSNAVRLLAACLIFAFAMISGTAVEAGSPIVDPYYANRQAAIERLATQQSQSNPYDVRSTGFAGQMDEGYEDEGEDSESDYYGPDDGQGSYLDGDGGYGADQFYSNGCGVDSDGCDFSGDMSLPCYGDQYLENPCPQEPGPGALWQDVHSGWHCWVNVDYLNWWTKGNYLPPLVTTSPIDTPQAVAGVLGQPTTDILFGNERVNGDRRNGGRIQFGVWLVEGEFVGLEGFYYSLQSATTRFGADSEFSTGDPNARILARPFFNAVTNQPDRRLIAFPLTTLGATINGSVSASSSSDVQSAGLGLRQLLFVDFVRDCRTFVTGGYRFFKLDEDLLVADEFRPVNSQFPPGSSFPEFDSFVTSNQFHGGYVGLLYDHRHKRMSLQAQTQLGMGNMHEVVNINGLRITNIGGGTQTFPGGLLTQPSNLGKHTRDQFVLIPEVEFKLGYQWLPWLKTTMGYNFTYITRVVRPGNEVSLTINNNQVANPTPAVPQAQFNATDFWLQGFTSGVEIRF